MAVREIVKDVDALTMRVYADFVAAPDQVWELWANPRKLERWWGPPTHPATFVDHALAPGATCTYYMTGPDGERYHGWWDVVEVVEGARLVVRDGFADAEGHRMDLPESWMTVELRPVADGTEVVITSQWATLEAMQQVIAMGMEEGLRAAMSQMEGVLAHPEVGV